MMTGGGEWKEFLIHVIRLYVNIRKKEKPLRIGITQNLIFLSLFA